MYLITISSILWNKLHVKASLLVLGGIIVLLTNLTLAMTWSAYYAVMEIRLDGKRALVTGAGKGIGREISKKLVEYGAETFALSRTKEDLDSLKEEVPSINVIHLDLVDWDKIREAIANVGPIDLLVNNAAILITGSFLETSREDLDRITDVNFKAAYNVAQAVSKTMVETGNGGAIVNMSSLISTKSIAGFSIYCSFKAALDMLTKCMALELGPKKIRVNAVNPGMVITPMVLKNETTVKMKTMVEEKTPLGKCTEVKDVVDLVVFLLSDRSSMITGECIKIDGGYGLA